MASANAVLKEIRIRTALQLLCTDLMGFLKGKYGESFLEPQILCTDDRAG